MKQCRSVLMMTLVASLAIAACAGDGGNAPGADVAVLLQNVEQTGGVDGEVDSTGLTLTFDEDPTTLAAEDITVSGAVKGSLTGSGTTRILAISGITAANGETVTVTIASPLGYEISGSPKTAVVYRASYQLFAANDAEHGRELWKTDGTSEGTVLVRDIWEGPEVEETGGVSSVRRAKGRPIPIGFSGNGNPGSFTWFNDAWFFVADDGTGEQLWMSDGTAAGTVKVSRNVGWSELSELISIDGMLYFSIRDSNGDYSIGISDGTAAGTRVFYAGAGALEYCIAMNDKTYFVCNDNGSQKLWESDGANGLKRAVGTESMERTSCPVQLNGAVFFENYSTGLLYSYDGTSVSTFTDTVNHPNPSLHGAFNGKLFFSTYVTGTGPCRLWVTDGTPSGTKDLGVVGNRPQEITAYAGKIFYMQAVDNAGTGSTDYSLAETDGVSPVSATALDGKGENLTIYKNNLYFTVSTATQYRLCRYAGVATPAVVSTGSRACSSFHILNGRMLFSGQTATTGDELWVSDGTEAGTALLKDIYPGTYVSPFDGKEYPNNSSPFVFMLGF